MAKICPLTGEKVVYLVCNECEDKRVCNELIKANKDKTNSK